MDSLVNFRFNKSRFQDVYLFICVKLQSFKVFILFLNKSVLVISVRFTMRLYAIKSHCIVFFGNLYMARLLILPPLWKLRTWTISVILLMTQVKALERLVSVFWISVLFVYNIRIASHIPTSNTHICVKFKVNPSLTHQPACEVLGLE